MLLGKMSTESHIWRLPPRLGVPSVSTSYFTSDRCLVWCQWDPQVLHHEYIEKPNQVTIRQVFCPSWLSQQLHLDTTMPTLKLKGSSGHKEGSSFGWCWPHDSPIVCPAKWQTCYNLMENTTPVSTRALLFVLENIKKHAELDSKPPSMIKSKRAEGKHKMELMDSCIPKMSCKGLVNGPKSTPCYARSIAGTQELQFTGLPLFSQGQFSYQEEWRSKKPQPKEKGWDQAIFAQIVWVNFEKVFHKKSLKH